MKLDLHTCYPYWLLKSGFIEEYPSLQEDLRSHVVILGGGVTGALMAWHLAEAGIEVTVIDGRHIGMGSTCASTAILQYEIDTPLYELAENMGLSAGLRGYKACIEAIDALEELSADLKVDVGFERRPSLQYASQASHVRALKQEYEIRKRNGIDVEWLEKGDVERMFGFKAPGGLYSPHDGAQLDPYRFTHALLQAARKKGVKVYDKTRVEKIEPGDKGVVLHTVYGAKVKARHLVMATGYEAYTYLEPKWLRLNSTYAIASEPYAGELWPKGAMIWETARPYIYMRTTGDGRVLVGGKDEPFYDPGRRDALVNRKASLLKRAFEKLFPELAPLRIDFNWAGTFAETPDGLPYIGKMGKYPSMWFALGFGGNGIPFSQAAALIVRDGILGEKNKDEEVFGFARVGGK